MERLLAIDVAFLRLVMPTMRIDEMVFRQMPQPDKKRHRRVLQIVLQPATRFEHDLLHNIAGVDALHDSRIEPQVDHAAHRLAMTRQQLLNGVGPDLSSLVAKLLRVRCLWPHDNHSLNPTTRSILAFRRPRARCRRLMRSEFPVAKAIGPHGCDRVGARSAHPYGTRADNSERWQ